MVTGESVGQVASQTLPAMVCTDAVAQLPVLRPLCGMDKEEIMEISRKIGTFDISIQPYEDLSLIHILLVDSSLLIHCPVPASTAS